MSEQTPGTPELQNPYGGRVIVPDAAAPGAVPPPRRVRVHHLREMKQRGERFAMLTAYDQYAAAVFEEAGIPVLLVGDSAANNVLGYETTVPVTVDELVPLVRADLPFGSYQAGPDQALATSMRMMKEGLAHAVKVEGGARIAPSVEHVVGAGIPVMAHVGFTPQSEHALGGYRVQGRGQEGVEKLVADATALEAAGAFAIVLEMVPAPAAAEVTKALSIPTIGIGAGPDCDGQVLVWQDMMGLRTGKAPRFVKRYADLHGVMLDAARAYADEVRGGAFPGPEHAFEA
jgi:3-methyl-2-oxobutanoate hydroxymethyltransferase